MLLPLAFVYSIVSSASRLDKIYDTFLDKDDDISHGAQCYLRGKVPSTLLDREQGYKDDPGCTAIMTVLKSANGKSIPDVVISSVHMGYRLSLRKKLMHMLGGKLVLFKPVNMNSKYIILLVVPLSLCRKLFSHYHAGPSGGHMGKYKTLFRLRLRFLWPTMREEIKSWVKMCAHCIYITFGGQEQAKCISPDQLQCLYG